MGWQLCTFKSFFFFFFRCPVEFAHGMDSNGEAGFGIGGPDSKLVIVRGNQLYGLFILGVKLQVA